MKILIKSAWGSDDPTKAAFAFLHANAFAEAGHEVQIFLLGEAVSLMKDAVMNSVVPVGWPPLSETIPRTIQHKIPSIYERLARWPVRSPSPTLMEKCCPLCRCANGTSRPSAFHSFVGSWHYSSFVFRRIF